MAALVITLVGLCSLPQALAQFSLNLVHWGDLHGRMVPASGRGAVPCVDPVDDPACYGGLARAATACKAQKDANPTTLCLDAGDSFSGAYWADVDDDASYLQVMNTFVDAYVVGNRDFDKGVDYLEAFVENATFPVLGACNMDLSKEPRLNNKIEKWATFNFAGTNVAILGFTNVDQSPAMSTITSNIGFYEPSDPDGMIECINEFKFQNPGSWVIGILSHAGVSGDLQLVRQVNSVQLDISFVVGGHSHEPFFPGKRGPCLVGGINATTGIFQCDEKSRETSRYNYPEDAASSAGTIKLLHAGWAGKYVGQAVLQYNANLLLADSAGSLLPLGRYYTEEGAAFQVNGDPALEQQLSADMAALQQFKQQPIATLPEPLVVAEPAIYTSEQPAGGVICSALMWNARNLGFVGTPESPLVCVQNAATIRRSLEGSSGPVNVIDVENFLPPEEGLTLTIVEIERSALLGVLENSVSTLNTANMETPDNRYLHVGGGLQFSYDVTGQPYQFNRTSGELLSPGSRVQGVTYDCSKINEGPVRVVLNSQLAEGIEGYVGLKDGEVLLTFGPLLSEAVASYLDAAAPNGGMVAPNIVNIPAQINAPPPCNSSTAWKDVPAEAYALVPPPVMPTAAPAANATDTPAPGASPPPGGTAPPPTPGGGSPPTTAPPIGDGVSGISPSDVSAEAGAAAPESGVAADSSPASPAATALAAAGVCAAAAALVLA